MAASDPVLRGVAYALTRGLDPRKKDGARAHPTVLVAGMLFHAGIAGAAVSLIVGLIGRSPSPLFHLALIGVSVAGAAAGVVLLLRRLREPVLKAISIPDDYISNLLVVLVLIASATSLAVPGLTSAFQALTLLLILYAPFGKIRHCVLFFIARARFGVFIGTRGVLVGSRRR